MVVLRNCQDVELKSHWNHRTEMEELGVRMELNRCRRQVPLH